MKIKDKKDLRAKTKKDLWDLLKEKKEKISELRIQQSQNKLKNTSEIFVLRKDIASILTLLREAELVKAEVSKKEEKGEKSK